MIRDAISSRLALALLVAAATLTSGCNQSSNLSAAQTEAKEHAGRSDTYRQQGQFRAAIIEANNAIRLVPNDAAQVVKLAELFNELGQGKQASKLLEPFAAKGDQQVMLALAEAYLQQHKYQSALDTLSQATSRLNIANDEELRLKQARAQISLGEFDSAQPVLQALADSPKVGVNARLELARMAFLQNDPDTGNTLVEQILQSDPNQVGALILAATQAENEGNLERAEDQLSRALMHLPNTDIMAPEKADILQKLTTILTKRGRSTEALVYSKALSDANPAGALLQDKFRQGVELFQEGKMDEAEALLKEVYDQSHNDQVGTLLGMIRYSKNDLAGADAYLGANVDPEVASDGALLALASAQLRMRQPGKLLELIGPQERERLKNPQLKALVGIALLQQGDTGAGEALILQAQSAAPDNKAIKAALARHYLVSAQPQKAISLLQGSASTDSGLQQLLITGYIHTQKPDQALAAAQKLAGAQPAQSANYAVYGHTALLTGHYDIAITALKKALELRPDNIAAQTDLAQVYLAQKHPEQAQPIYQKLVEANAANVTAIKGLVTCEEIAGNNAPGAIEARVLKVSNSDTARAVLAEYYLRNRNIADADRLLSNIPTSADAYLNQVRQLFASTSATLALQARDYEKARLALISGLRSDAGNPTLLAALADIEIRTGNPKGAEKVVDQLSANPANAPLVLELKGDIAAAARQWDIAATQYRQAWKLAPGDTNGHKLYRSLNAGNPAAATQFLDEWSTALPGSGWPYFFRGAALQQKGDTAAAIKAYESALARNGNNAMAQNNLAWSYHESGDNRALATARKAFELEPKNPVILDTLGWLLVKERQLAQGIAHLEEAAKLAPSSKEIAEHLSQARALR